MEASDPFESYVRIGLERLGFTPDDTDIAVIRATDSIYGPQIDAMLSADLSGVAAEPEIDLSRPPEPA
jgi:hypothetical protein